MGPVEYTSYYGKKRTIRKFKGIPLREDGVDKLLLVVEDITDQRESEEKLEKSEEKYRFIAENVNDIIFMQDMDSNITYVSPSVKKVTGYTPEEVTGMKLKDLMTEDSYRKAWSCFSKAVKNAKKGDFNIPLMQFEYMRKDGSTIWGELKVKFIRDSKGQLKGSSGILRDITEKKKAEDAYHSIVDNSLQGIVIIQGG